MEDLMVAGRLEPHLAKDVKHWVAVTTGRMA